MSDDKQREEWRNLPFAMRLTDEELDLVRWIGARMSRLLLGRYEELPYMERNDDLGIVANMMVRVARELRQAKQRDLVQKKELEAQKRELEAQKNELEARVSELETARAEAAKLLGAVRELAAPILAVHRGVILVPIAGALDRELLEQAEERVLSSVGAANARAVILDITGAKAIEATVAEGLVRIARAVSLLGARVVLCGVSAAAARTAVEQGLDFAPAILRSDLSSAIDAAMAEENGFGVKAIRKRRG
jgi:rsbT co-antagonist protein RsbR